MIETREVVVRRIFSEFQVSFQETSEREGEPAIYGIYQFGGRQVRLDVYPESRWVGTFVINSGLPHQPGDTTRVYEQVKDFCQALADEVGEAVTYELQTHHEQMLAWAKDPLKGSRVFNWDSIREIVTGKRTKETVFTKIFMPRPEG